MKITVLMENTAQRCDMSAEHGLSLLIRTKAHTILFDMGQSDAFARNAQALGIDLKEVDIAVLSHGHYDHGGGLQTFLDINDQACVYLSRHAFGEYYHGPDKYIGLAKALKQSARLRYVAEDLIIDDELSLHACNDRPVICPTDAFGLSEVHSGTHTPDRFLHEHYLRICEDGKTVLISGCAHKGVVNIAHWFRPDVLVGGFHLAKLDPVNPEHRERLTQTAHALLSSGGTYYTGHCTGAPAYAFLKDQMNERLHALSTGMTFEI